MEVKTFDNKVKKEPKLRYSEAFYSVQGEGRWVGVPSLFLRTFGCNFEFARCFQWPPVDQCTCFSPWSAHGPTKNG